MLKSIGILELNSIARGIDAADTMLKTADVELFTSTPVCPGKYFILIHGDVAAVESAIKAGVSKAKEYIVDEIILPRVHPQVYPTITCTNPVAKLKSLGIVESFSIAAMVMGADAALKAAAVDAVDLRLGTGIGGKSFFTMTGDVAAVEAAVEAAAASVAGKGMLVEKVVIPSPSPMLLKNII